MRARRLIGRARAPGHLREDFVRWVTRRHRADGRCAAITRDRVYILPTRHGYMLLAVLLVMLLGAINYSNNMAFLLTFLIAGVGHNAMWYTHRNLLGLRVSVLPVMPVFAGQVPELELRIEETSGRSREALQLAVAEHRGLPAHLGALGTTDVAVALERRPRGLYRLPRQQLSTRFPLGLLKAWSWLSLDAEILVYPQPVQPTTVLPASNGAMGPHEGTLRVPDAPPEDIREYRPGDAPGRIVWKAVARTGRLFVRDSGSTDARPIWLDWTMIPDSEPEYRLSALCHLVLEAHAADESFGLRLPGTAPLGPGTGPEHLQRCLRALAVFGHPGGITA
ncbi:protein of unknown function DUF58 [Thioalkalivibrio nitratireducens DSM 14787]|uniref:Uncharacterized protein n=1 Tax=Thioalkalivibrio nitratireducens (strain DSM 14787 / UNIQEM 213 / ALEN2) TaxID=1255043 RepID=L0DV59_THIND|nr:DUF58 domain-containing protein [Thioalkalivibrio nitratireducens]AGA32903.1 protein of unknown function DUF58 [Thioalkalivibrio nitratireducens DSM 14787]